MAALNRVTRRIPVVLNFLKRRINARHAETTPAYKDEIADSSEQRQNQDVQDRPTLRRIRPIDHFHRNRIREDLL